MVDDKIWKQLKAVGTPIDPPPQPYTPEEIAEADRLLKKYGFPIRAEIAIAVGLITKLTAREREESSKP
jgi:hypothetical protein